MTSDRRPSPSPGRVSPPEQPVARRWRPGPGGTVLILLGPIQREDIAAVCERARVLLTGCDAEPVPCDVWALVRPDAVTIDALARLQLTARRLGRAVELRRACVELVELVRLAGLHDVLPHGGVSGAEPRREPEQREQARGVEEEADPGDRAL